MSWRDDPDVAMRVRAFAIFLLHLVISGTHTTDELLDALEVCRRAECYEQAVGMLTGEYELGFHDFNSGDPGAKEASA